MTLHTGRLMALICSAVILFLTSCEDGDSLHALPDEGKGKVMLSLYSDIEIKSPQAISEVDDYNFRFVGVGEYGTSQYYRYGDVSWPMDWYFGIFRLQAESCTADEAESGYGKLRYEGIGQPFSVINDQTATASVVCSVANFRVVANFNDKMFMSYKDFKLVVESVLMPVYEEDEDGNQILVNFYNSKTGSGYWETGELPDIDLMEDSIFYILDTESYYNSMGGGSNENGQPAKKAKKHLLQTVGICEGTVDDYYNYRNYMFSHYFSPNLFLKIMSQVICIFKKTQKSIA